jgi:hypothetical protein
LVLIGQLDGLYKFANLKAFLTVLADLVLPDEPVGLSRGLLVNLGEHLDIFFNELAESVVQLDVIDGIALEVAHPLHVALYVAVDILVSTYTHLLNGAVLQLQVLVALLLGAQLKAIVRALLLLVGAIVDVVFLVY